MDITPEKRAKLVALNVNTDMSIRDIANAVCVAKSTVSRLLAVYKAEGSVSPKRKGRCGRKRITTVRDDRFLVRQSKRDPRKTSSDLQRDLSHAGVVLDSSTVRRRLLEVGRKARRPIKKQLLTVAMKKKRLLWAKEHKMWCSESWRKVIFSDETLFEVQGCRSSFVRRSDGETISSDHIQQTPKHTIKQMFWGCFSASGLGTLVPVEGMMNQDKYIDILSRKVLTELSNLYPDGDGIFQQDLAPCHTARRTKVFMEHNNIQMLSWPGNSPDLSPIENLWSIIKRKLQRHDCGTLAKLITSVNHIWNYDDELKETCCKLVDSMPNRVNSLIAARGGHIHY